MLNCNNTASGRTWIVRALAIFLVLTQPSFAAKENCKVQFQNENTLQENLKKVSGREPLKPSPNSLVGEYLAKTGAASVIRTFPKGPGYSGSSPRRLVVAVSARTFPTYLRLFRRPEFLIHVHTPSQGTLLLAHNGKAGSWANLNAPFRFPSIGTLMPHILLSGTEAKRAQLIFDVGRDSNLNEAIQHPWALADRYGRSYCPPSAYGSCTHWFGNLPIGEELVNTYLFPGAVDNYADNRVDNAWEDASAPREGALYDYEGLSGNPLTQSQLNRLHKVWSVPGHQQLWEVLGLQDQQEKAELANPGWVAYSILSRLDRERLPVVFLAVDDETQPISPRFDLQISAH